MTLSKKLFFAGGDNDGCFHYRSKLPAKFLGMNASPGYRVKDELRDECDIIILERATNPYFLEEIPKLKVQGKKVLYDIDDNLWNIPSTNKASSAYTTKVLKETKEIIKLCDGMIVSTEPLKSYFLKEGFNENIHEIPNFLDDVFPERIPSDQVTVAFCGTDTHKGDFDFKLVDALRSLKGKCKLVFVGYNPIPGFENEYIQWIPTDDYLQTVYSLNIDIAIAPLQNVEFNRGKSNLKWLEFSSMNTCFVGSNVYPYEKSIVNKTTGILINNPKEWKSTLEWLINNRTERNLMSFYAKETVNKNYTYKNNGQFIIDKYKEVINGLY